MGDFLMPSLGADMAAGTVVEWLVGPGDAVHRGDVIAVVDTDKADIEVEVFEDGTVEELLVPADEEVPVGTPLARIRATGPAEPAEPAEGPRLAAVGPDPTGGAPPARVGPPRGPAEHVRASPRARRLAAERGVDLGAVAGTGPEGAVRNADLLRAPAATPAPATRVRRDDADRRAAMRAAIGDLMARSARDIPHYHLAVTIDLRTATTWLTEHNGARPVTERVLPAALLLKAVARAAREVPGVNGTWDQGFRPADRVHLGVAVALRGGGLIAPAIHDADALNVDELMAALADLVARARGGRLRSGEMADATLTVTNLGDTGADEVHGLIYPPQVALVGFGRIVDRPWAADGMLGVHPTVRASLAADHRVTDGREGSRFLTVLDHLLQSPEEL